MAQFKKNYDICGAEIQMPLFGFENHIDRTTKNIKNIKFHDNDKSRYC